jgi:DNA polymerase I-like protein with 3'-5' exonuclease and polymerase domains
MGWTFVEADYSQVELRIAAMLADEGTLLRIFSTGGDPHLTTAAELTSKIPEDITSEERKHAKPVNFGFLYGMGHKKLPIYALDNYGVVISEADAYEYRQRYFRLYPKLPEWHDRQRRLAKRYGYVQSPIGRVRHLPDIRSNDNGVRAEAERQAINSPVQSFASDLMLLSLIELMRILPQGEVQIVGTVHDSILFLVRDQALNWALPTIRDVMEDMSLVRKKFGTDMTVILSLWRSSTEVTGVTAPVVWNEG